MHTQVQGLKLGSREQGRDHTWMCRGWCSRGLSQHLVSPGRRRGVSVCLGSPTVPRNLNEIPAAGARLVVPLPSSQSPSTCAVAPSHRCAARGLGVTRSRVPIPSLPLQAEWREGRGLREGTRVRASCFTVPERVCRAPTQRHLGYGPASPPSFPFPGTIHLASPMCVLLFK